MVATNYLATVLALSSMLASALSSSATGSESGLQRRTLDPCSSNTPGKCPATVNCSASKVSKAIQAAECSHNTRTSTTQTFAVFVTDHQYDSSHGAPYGTCSAYTCTAPTTSEMTDVDADCWTFFWSDGGEEEGVGTNCIESPTTGECGCEYSNGTFVEGATDCT